MSSHNRGDRIQLLQKVLKKHYTPVLPTEGRSVLEQLIYAGCLEDSLYDAAEEAFQRLQELYFDWNEVRVTTVTELADAIKNLQEPNSAANRIKRSLQSIFETRYSFDLEDMHKMNQGKAIQELAKFSGVSRFMLAYVIQHSFGGHTIPVSDSIMKILVMTGVVTPAEADKHQTPGLERAVPKSKGLEVASCLQQLAAEYKAQPNNKNVKAILKEAGAVEPKPAEPAKPAKPDKPEPKPSETKVTAKSLDAKPTTKPGKEVKPNKPAGDSKPGKTLKEPNKTSDIKKTETKKVDAKKPDAKKAEAKKVEAKKPPPPKKPTKHKPAVAAKKPVVKKITKRKPK